MIDPEAPRPEETRPPYPYQQHPYQSNYPPSFQYQQQPLNGDSPESKRIYNLLRLWGGTALFVITLGLAIFDVIDDMALGNHYPGVPIWLTGTFSGLITALFGPLVMQGVSRGIHQIWRR